MLAYGAFAAVWIAPRQIEIAKEEEVEQKKRIQKAKQHRKEQEQEYVNAAEKLLEKYSDLVAKFMSIAERKVGVVDEYGEENWEALPDEINRLACKIAEREGLPVKNGTITLKTSYGDPNEKIYSAVGNIAAIRFQKHHEKLSGATTVSREDFAKMSGVEFETYIIKLLKEKGYEQITGTATTGDQGADILAIYEGRRIVIQAKCYAKPVGNKAVQEVTAALRYYNSDEAWVVTNATFTPAAKALAHKNKVKLIDGTALIAKQF